MPQAGGMAHPDPKANPWRNQRIGITGARGALGQALTAHFRSKGAHVTGLTHSPPPAPEPDAGPHQWLQWTSGQEEALLEDLRHLDLLVLNHGINPQGLQSPDALTHSIEINALSSWRLIQLFERCTADDPDARPREIWVNTSEAEIQPAISPAYEISKRLIGQLVSIHGAIRPREERERLRLRKLVLGPFRSDLNPIGVMTAGFVAQQILWQAGLGLRLIIVSPNPLTYVLMPVTELGRRLYSSVLNPPGR
ncbi:MAG: SDR family oxidoreductase [Synechococcus sp.]